MCAVVLLLFFFRGNEGDIVRNKLCGLQNCSNDVSLYNKNGTLGKSEEYFPGLI